MQDDVAAALRDMRDQHTVQQQQMIAIDAATMQLLTNGRAALEQGRRLVEWFNRAQQAGRIPAPHR
jgi:hypothetical protein